MSEIELRGGDCDGGVFARRVALRARCVSSLVLLPWFDVYICVLGGEPMCYRLFDPQSVPSSQPSQVRKYAAYKDTEQP